MRRYQVKLLVGILIGRYILLARINFNSPHECISPTTDRGNPHGDEQPIRTHGDR